jgi:hypothetical protein
VRTDRRPAGYEVYLPSFQDSNGDGCGDLAGVPLQGVLAVRGTLPERSPGDA